MSRELEVEPACPATLELMRSAVVGAGLPVEDIEDPGPTFRVFRLDKEIVGFGGLENRGEDWLLRSVVVEPEHRGEGMGRRIVEILASTARAAGARRLYLLTKDAAPFFKSQSFAEVDRETAPESVRTTRQMSSLCPGSAQLLMRDLTK